MRRLCNSTEAYELLHGYHTNQQLHFASVFNPSFGKHSHDEMSILVPLTQCCR